MSIKILEEIKAFILREYKSYILQEPVIIRRRLRAYLTDNSFIDIRYPNLKEYSLHWQGRNKIIRIDTAPHHINLRSYPRHIHLYTEDNIIEDNITMINASPEENIRKYIEFVLEKRKDP